MSEAKVSRQLVKMEGNFVNPVPWWRLDRKIINKVRGVEEFPAEPAKHPKCIEIMEGSGEENMHVVFRRSPFTQENK